MSLTRRVWRHFALREAVLDAGEVYCADPDPRGSGGIMCTRPAGHDGRHAAHGEDPDKPLWTWPADSAATSSRDGEPDRAPGARGEDAP